MAVIEEPKLPAGMAGVFRPAKKYRYGLDMGGFGLGDKFRIIARLSKNLFESIVICF